MNESRYDERLMCEVISLSYDFGTQTAELYLPATNCCDMTGCVELFEAIDPKVVAINTHSGDRIDTAYRKAGAEWKAYGPREPR